MTFFIYFLITGIAEAVLYYMSCKWLQMGKKKTVCYPIAAFFTGFMLFPVHIVMLIHEVFKRK